MKYLKWLVLVAVACGSGLAGEADPADELERRLDAAFREGRAMTADEAPSLEEKLAEDPNDLVTRAMLLGIYGQSWDAASRATRAEHVVWMIANHPALRFTASPACLIMGLREKENFRAARETWNAKLQANPNDPAVLRNAAQFLTLSEPESAQKLMEIGMKNYPDDPQWPRMLGQLHSMLSRRATPREEAERLAASLAAYERALDLETGIERVHRLKECARAALTAGETEKATRYAKLLLAEGHKALESFPEGAGAYHGIAVHHAHLVLGLVAFDENDLEGAKRHLIESGKTPGAPTLNSFGPNMSLAAKLLERDERKAVLEYLDLCGVFWRSGGDKLAKWKATVEAGGLPDFGGNLVY